MPRIGVAQSVVRTLSVAFALVAAPAHATCQEEEVFSCPIGKKVVEEAAEAWMAAEHETTERAAEEISQLLYHIQCMMLASKVSLEDVYRRL